MFTKKVDLPDVTNNLRFVAEPTVLSLRCRVESFLFFVNIFFHGLLFLVCFCYLFVLHFHLCGTKYAQVNCVHMELRPQNEKIAENAKNMVN